MASFIFSMPLSEKIPCHREGKQKALRTMKNLEKVKEIMECHRSLCYNKLISYLFPKAMETGLLLLKLVGLRWQGVKTDEKRAGALELAACSGCRLR